MNKINEDFLMKIQPAGGITFKDEAFVRTGDGYEECLHVMRFPTDLDDFWLSNIMNINGTVATVDISSQDVNIVMKNLNRSMKEQNVRYQTAKNYSDQSDAENKFADMKRLMDNLNGLDEVVKYIDARIFVSDRSLFNLDEKVKKLKTHLDTKGYLTFTNLNETKSDWRSIHLPYVEQQKDRFVVPGQTMTAYSIAGGNPFHFSSLEDPHGDFWGTTTVGGNVLLDLFFKSKTRRFYNALGIGTMGAGKSTLLKKTFEDRAIRGDFIRTFDVAGEFRELTKTFGGKVLKMDGTDDSSLNPLEILRSGDNDDVNYGTHISKLKTIYKFLKPGVSQEELNIFSNLMYEMYEILELTPKKGREITGRPSTEYPIFSDFHDFITQKKIKIANEKYDDVSIVVAQNEMLIMDNIDKCILDKAINNYGSILNRHTSMDNIVDEQIITFDISDLKNMDSSVFDAQVFSLISLSFDNAVTNGKAMYQMYREGKINFEDIVHTSILIDESHRIINVEKLQALDLIITYMREARKYFAGILLASQSIRDYVPEGSSAIELNKLKTLFELTQYKFIFHQDSNALGLIRSVFDDVLTEEQITMIPTLQMGQCILSIASTANIIFNLYITKEEEKIFTGGV